MAVGRDGRWPTPRQTPAKPHALVVLDAAVAKNRIATGKPPAGSAASVVSARRASPRPAAISLAPAPPEAANLAKVRPRASSVRGPPTPRVPAAPPIHPGRPSSPATRLSRPLAPDSKVQDPREITEPSRYGPRSSSPRVRALAARAEAQQRAAQAEPAVVPVAELLDRTQRARAEQCPTTTASSSAELQANPVGPRSPLPAPMSATADMAALAFAERQLSIERASAEPIPMALLAEQWGCRQAPVANPSKASSPSKATASIEESILTSIASTHEIVHEKLVEAAGPSSSAGSGAAAAAAASAEESIMTSNASTHEAVNSSANDSAVQPETLVEEESVLRVEEESVVMNDPTEGKSGLAQSPMPKWDDRPVATPTTSSRPSHLSPGGTAPESTGISLPFAEKWLRLARIALLELTIRPPAHRILRMAGPPPDALEEDPSSHAEEHKPWMNMAFPNASFDNDDGEGEYRFPKAEVDAAGAGLEEPMCTTPVVDSPVMQAWARIIVKVLRVTMAGPGPPAPPLPTVNVFDHREDPDFDPDEHQEGEMGHPEGFTVVLPEGYPPRNGHADICLGDIMEESVTWLELEAEDDELSSPKAADLAKMEEEEEAVEVVEQEVPAALKDLYRQQNVPQVSGMQKCLSF